MTKYLDEYRDKKVCLELLEKVKEISTKPLRIMEVCGGHTMAIRKNGIQKLVGGNIKLISGPGCPVCVTAIEDIDKIVSLAGFKNVSICTFGDMMYVPGTSSSLSKISAAGGDVRIVYSVLDVLEFARSEKAKHFVFISIGFETTAPTEAAAIIQADRENLDNFSVIALNKTMPQALKAVLQDKNSKIDALICPGHVSAITGTDMYKSIVEDLGVSCCVSGFEPVDLLGSIYKLTELKEENKTALINAYKRAVCPEGNKKAQEIIYEVFEEGDTNWRGIGVIQKSGLKIKEKYKKFDAERRFDIKPEKSIETTECICGDILRGAKTPRDCALFKRVCTPTNPKGACMVSSEGTCSAWYKYGE